MFRPLLKSSILSTIGLLLWSGVACAGVSAEFNRPTSFLNSDHQLEKALIRYIDAAAPATRAYMSFYQLKSKKVISSIHRAHRRGVELHVVMDNVALERGYSKALQQLQAGLPTTSVTVCETPGCLNPDGNNHNKFFLFEKIVLDGLTQEFVTIQASHNFKKSQTFNFNDMLIFTERADIFRAFQSYWQALHHQSRKLDYMGSSTGQFLFPGADQTSLYFAPSLELDPYQAELESFVCGAGEVLLAQSFFAGTRGKALLERLERIKRQSPRCRIVALVRNDDAHNDLKKEMKASPVKFKQISRLKSLGVSVHSKMMLLKDEHGRKRVVTGSMNMVDRSLRGDETVIGITDGALYDSYLAYWEFINSHTR